MSEIPGVETTNPAANLSQCTSSLFPTKMAVLPGITLAIDRNSMSKCQHWKVGEKSVKCPANDATALNSPGMAGSRRKSQSSRAPKSCCCRAQAARIRRCYKFFALHFSIEWGKALLWHWSEDAQDAQAPLKWVSTSKFLGTCCTRWDDATFSPLLRAKPRFFCQERVRLLYSGGFLAQHNFLCLPSLCSCTNPAEVLEFIVTTTNQHEYLNDRESSNSPTKTTTLGDFDLSI